MKFTKALLVLEDGTAFEGYSLGKVGETVGELVIYTGVVGYQEVVTDPSYGGTLVVFSYPIIGSYGVNDEDNETSSVQANGLVIKEYSQHYSNFRAKGPFDEFLSTREGVGIQDIDTRAVSVHVRKHGEMKAVISSTDTNHTSLLEKLKSMPSPFSINLVEKLVPAKAMEPVGEASHRIAIIDLGAKSSLLLQLAQLGCSVTMLNQHAGADQVMKERPEGVIISGGPGDPHTLNGVSETVGALLGKVPVLGIGLGHQVLAMALGCKVKRMKLGHHAVNIPVRELPSGKCSITTQHHSYVVEADSLPNSVEVAFENLDDKTVEGVRSKKHVAWSVQFHPHPNGVDEPAEVLRRFLAEAKS